jgi:pimeloyl-ACP methyl ester carboxylesterase
MSIRAAVVCAGLSLCVACTGDVDPTLAPTAHARAGIASSGVDQIVDGSTGPGSVYRLVRPAHWNGTLVIYAHGYVSADQPVALPAEADQFVSLLVPQGFAIAYSSFSETGWDVKDGAQRTHQILGLFTSTFGKPTSTLIGGASMGGLIAIKLVETYPRTYAGMLAACALSGGTRMQFEYYANVRALFDLFYPGVLPGTAVYLPPGTDPTTDLVAPAAAAMTANPAPAFYIAAITQTPVPYASPAELIQSIVTALVGNAGSNTDVLLTRGKPYFDNQSTTYTSAVLPPPLLQAVNLGIGRFSAVPSVLASFDHNYTPTGDLRVPTLMLSDARDPVAPAFHRQAYLAAVTANGAAGLLVQRDVPTYGHCVFTPQEIGTALTDLALWVQYGIKP